MSDLLDKIWRLKDENQHLKERLESLENCKQVRIK